jgi:hypothetical protein
MTWQEVWRLFKNSSPATIPLGITNYKPADLQNELTIYLWGTIFRIPNTNAKVLSFP